MTGRLAFAFALSLILAYPLRTQQQPTHPFPTKDQISLLVSQAERAFDSYEKAVQQESQVAAKNSEFQEQATRYRESLKGVRLVVAILKRDPDQFTAPMGFLLVGDLDDSSRNMLACAAQAVTQAAFHMHEDNQIAAAEELHLEKSCLDTSQLLYTVSESAFSLYDNYLLANNDAMQSLLQEVQRCLGILKNQKKG